MNARRLTAALERWPLKQPFQITGYTFDAIDVLLVTLERHGAISRGEAAGIYYFGETPQSMIAQIEAVRAPIENGIDRATLQSLLPAGGARNALDCAMWELEAQLSGRPVWQLAGLQPPRPLLTTFTCGADTPWRMAEAARGYAQARAIKLKLTGKAEDADRVIAVREAKPDVWLGVDANQGFDRDFLRQLMPTLVGAGVALIEQPFRVGAEALLDGFESPIPIAADESMRTLADLEGLVGRVSVVNIKLDKCGGLTEGLEIARRAKSLGFDVMVGNMLSSSLAMAPAFLVGQLCQVVDLDAPALLAADREIPIAYHDGFASCPELLWGYPRVGNGV